MNNHMDTATKIYGLVGYPVKHSLSPAMHNAAFKAAGIDAEYKLFEVKPEELESFLNKNDLEGFNITIPHKVKARKLLRLVKETTTHETQAVAITDAINTVKKDKSGKLLYYNTDVGGFRRALVDDLNFDPKDKSVLLIGCGGAGRAVIAALAIESRIKQLYVYEIDKGNIEQAKKHFDIYETNLGYKYEFISDISRVIKHCQLLVNATPVGMKDGDPSVIDKKLLRNRKDLFVYDLVYNRVTQLIEDAREQGAKAAGGLGMLLYQGVEAWQIWMERSAPIGVMREALKKSLKEL